MATIIREDEGLPPREKHPAGMVQAVLIAVEDIGIQKGEYQGKPKNRRKIVLLWETSKKQADGTPFLIWNTYTASMGDNANLRADLEGWNGSPFTTEELKAFDVDTFIGRNCLLNIVHSENGKYANIAGITPVMEGMADLKPVNTSIPDGIKKWLDKKRSEAVPLEAAPGSAPPHSEDDLPF